AVDSLLELDRGQYGFSEFGVGGADDGDVGDCRMLHEDVFDLCGIDVHTPRKNEIGTAVAEIQIAVFIQVSDVPIRCPSTLVIGAARLGRVVEVFESRPAGKVDGADLARGQLVAVVVHDVHDAKLRLADRAGMGEPVMAVDTGDPQA